MRALKNENKRSPFETDLLSEHLQRLIKFKANK